MKSNKILGNSWLPVKSQLYYHDAVLTFKWSNAPLLNSNGLTPPYLSLLFLKRGEVSGRVTQNSHFLTYLVLRALQDKDLFISDSLVME